MRKKLLSAMVLLLAGTMALCGAGALSQKISAARAKKVVATEQKKVASVGAVDDGVMQDEDMQEKFQTTKKKLLDKKLGMYLPDGAKVKEKAENGYIMKWNGYEIAYYSNEAAEGKDDFEREEAADVSIADAVIIAKDAVKKYSGIDITGEKVRAFLQRNVMEENQAVFAPDGRETDFTDVIPVVNKRNYGMKYYWVSLDHIHQFTTFGYF